MPRYVAFSFLCLMLFVLAASAPAQVLVYEVSFQKESGANYQPFEGGYFIAPLLGGNGTFLLTSTDDSHTYTVAADAGRLFTTVSNGISQSVMSAKTGAGTAEGAMVAIGEIAHTVQVNNQTLSLTAKVAKELNGTAVSADDESTAASPAPDGSLGSAGIAHLKLLLDDALTNKVNGQSLTLDKTVEQIKLELKRQSFTEQSATTGETAAPAAK